MKICTKCSKMLSTDEFAPRKAAVDGLYGWCRDCHRQYRTDWIRTDRRKKGAIPHVPVSQEAKDERRRERDRERYRKRRPHLMKNFGMTLEQFEVLKSEQEGLCAICKCPPRPEFELCVDHDHVTGKVRGLLCHKCNFGLGALGDNPEGLRAAIEYLEMTRVAVD